MSDRDALRYLRDAGWLDIETRAPAPVRRQEPAAPQQGVPATAGAQDVREAAPDVSQMNLAELAAVAAACRRCRLCQGRTQVVFGVGDPNARVMVVGEAPGAEEDRVGEPFVGRAGQLLNSMLQAIGLRREDVYIANIVKCRPPKNRDPEPDEAAACAPFLARQIELVDPEVVVTIGRIANRYLLGLKSAISSYRGRWQSHAGRDVLPTFHPAYLLRNPAAKAQAWADLKAIRDHLA